MRDYVYFLVELTQKNKVNVSNPFNKWFSSICDKARLLSESNNSKVCVYCFYLNNPTNCKKLYVFDCGRLVSYDK